ncbi:MAG: phosphoglycolate phosphatase [Polaromonas sp.]|nr:phosphoglycolate phosphatase [Polaromonas sp.]
MPPDVRAVRLSAFRAAIVDLDGTLVDTLGDFVAALNLALDELALPERPRLTAAEVASMVGKGSEYLVKSALDWLAAQYPRAEYAMKFIAQDDTALFDTAFQAYQKHYGALNGQHAMVYPGVHAGLQAMQQAGLALACLTNKPRAFATELLARKGLDGYFSHVYGGDSFERKKPDPLPLLKTCAALGLAPAEVLMVGDSSNDALAARAAGCPVVLVTYGYNHGLPVRSVDADGFIDSLAGLLPA